MVTSIKKTQIDFDQDGKVSKWEWDVFSKTVSSNENYKLTDATGQPQGSLDDIEKSLDSDFRASDRAEAREPSMDANSRVNQYVSQMNNLKAAYDRLKTSNPAEAEAILAKIAEILAKAEAANKTATKPQNLSAFEQLLNGRSSGNVKIQAATTDSFAGEAQKETKSSGTKASSFTPPSGWGVATGAPELPSNAFIRASLATDMLLRGQDEVNGNTNRGKQLMMLFLYFAKMAESGDMGAMYQFMKFITYIISKDKAKQQIEMGKKLIELQELSRSWTNKLLNVSSDPSNPDASNELMKQMTIVKSETDAIATSQKLISQMMEEFAQVVETLTNVTKAALEAYGRNLRTVSSIRM